MMSCNHVRPAVLVLGLLLFSTTVYAARESSSAITIHHGRVTELTPVDLESEAGRGALIGGLAGLASASGGNRSSRWRNAIIGAGVGGAVASSAEGSLQGMSYTVATTSGTSIRIVSDQAGIAVGDCVTVEQGADTANIRRVADTLCEMPDYAEDTVIGAELAEEAEECAEAKRGLLDAETDADIERAVVRVEVLCDD